MKISALLTGRGNNTLKDKNVLEIIGKPILQYPALEAQKVEMIDSYWVSSDCDKILSAANQVGYKKILRPTEYAQPDSQHIDVIDHALSVMKQSGDDPDILIVLLANTVTVKAEWIQDCILKILENPEITACVPVVKDLDHHPFRAKKIGENGFLEPFFDFTGKHISTNRQDLEESYFLCHNFWVLNIKQINRTTGQAPWIFMGNKVFSYEVDEAFDIHTTEDILRSEKWLIQQNIK
jgi:CMP-N,N'-diacetyllegionaminic acid synthase